MWEEINNDHEFLEMRRFHDDGFDKSYKEAYELYKSGDWKKAGPAYEDLHRRKPEDGPTRVLMNYINERDCVAPNDWHGVR